MPVNRLVLEVPVFDPSAALKAADYGADRLELCSSYFEGGLTPGPGVFSYLKLRIAIPIFVMIRPRGGDFVSSNEEIEVMFDTAGLYGIKCKSHFATGMVMTIATGEVSEVPDPFF